VPGAPTSLCLDLNVNRSILRLVAGHEVNLGHVARKGHGVRAALVDLGDNEVFAGATHLLVPSATRRCRS
jgi:hypothetical protein